MKKLYSILIIIIIALGFIIGNKIYYLVKFNNIVNNNTYKEIINNLEKIDNITINKSNETIKSYFSYNNLKIRNDFDDFEKSANSDFYVKEVDKEKAAFLIIEDSRIIDLLQNELNNKKISKYLNKYNIKEDIDYYKYLGDKNNLKLNIFNSLFKIKSTYIFYLYGELMISTINSITEINGDYNGYILDLKGAKEVNLYKNNKRYIISFINKDYFTGDYVKELISTIEIS